MNGLASHLDIKGLLPQAASSAFLTNCPSRITAEHIFILYLITVGLHPPEEFIQSNYRIFFRLCRTTLPDLVFHFLAQVAVRLEDRYLVAGRVPHDQILEPSHLVTSPACDSSVIYGLALVRNHKILAYTYDLAKTSAYRACSQRTVEAEKIFIRLCELDTISFEPVDKGFDRRSALKIFLSHIQAALTLVKRSLYR